MKKRLPILLFTLILLPLLLLGGCGLRSSLVSGILPDNHWPKKRVLVMPAVDLTGMPFSELIDAVSEELSTLLRKTGFFSVYHHETKRSFSLRPGEPIDPELMRDAKAMGINAVVFETVNPIETDPVKSGIWPFRKHARSYTVSMNIDVVDVNNGTIILSKDIAETITFPGEELEVQNEKFHDREGKERALKRSLPDIIKNASMAAQRSLNRHVWTGRIVSLDKERVIINAGRDAGLRPGIVFEVFGENEYITSFKGQTYHLHGPKVGEIKIVTVRARHSFATPINGTDFKSDQIIRVK